MHHQLTRDSDVQRGAEDGQRKARLMLLEVVQIDTARLRWQRQHLPTVDQADGVTVLVRDLQKQPRKDVCLLFCDRPDRFPADAIAVDEVAVRSRRLPCLHQPQAPASLYRCFAAALRALPRHGPSAASRAYRRLHDKTDATGEEPR